MYSLLLSATRDIAWNTLKFKDFWTGVQRTGYVDTTLVKSKMIEIMGCAPWTTRWAKLT